MNATPMQSQLSLFDAEQYCHLPGCEPAPARAIPHGSDVVCLDQAGMRSILPKRYLQGLDPSAKQVRPFDTALIIHGTGRDVRCDEMRWGNAADAELAPTLFCGGLWPTFRPDDRSRSCVVAVSRFAAIGHGDHQGIQAWVASGDGEPLYLAGSWRETQRGPVFSLFTHRASGKLRRAGSAVPLILHDPEVWEWLNASLWMWPPALRLMRRKDVIAFASPGDLESG